MILVNDNVLQYVIRDARMRNEETDELSSDVDNFEEFPRFVGVADFDRHRRATLFSEAHKNTHLRVPFMNFKLFYKITFIVYLYSSEFNLFKPRFLL